MWKRVCIAVTPSFAAEVHWHLTLALSVRSSNRLDADAKFSTLTSHGIRSGSLLPELLGEADENPFGTPDIAEPIHVFILGHLADELRAKFAESGERIVDVLYGEHDA